MTEFPMQKINHLLKLNTMNNKIFCHICESAYIETTQKNVEYVCNMCREYEEENNPNRILPNEQDINHNLVTDCGNH